MTDGDEFARRNVERANLCGTVQHLPMKPPRNFGVFVLLWRGLGFVIAFVRAAPLKREPAPKQRDRLIGDDIPVGREPDVELTRDDC